MTKLQDVVGRFDLKDKEDLIFDLELIELAIQMPQIDYETLLGCRKNGPSHDGNVLSKASRDYLVTIGAVARVVVKNEQGYNACTYKGWHLAKIYEFLNKIEPYNWNFADGTE